MEQRADKFYVKLGKTFIETLAISWALWRQSTIPYISAWN